MDEDAYQSQRWAKIRFWNDQVEFDAVSSTVG